MPRSQSQLGLFAALGPTSSSQLLRGTSSWTGDGWVGSFYPAGSQAADFLPYYAQRFPTVEIDTTFYRIPMAKTFEQWSDRTPKGFISSTSAELAFVRLASPSGVLASPNRPSRIHLHSTGWKIRQ